jgi:hypothetical protein
VKSMRSPKGRPQLCSVDDFRFIFAYDLHNGRRTAGHDTHANGREDLLLLPQQAATALPREGADLRPMSTPTIVAQAPYALREVSPLARQFSRSAGRAETVSGIHICRFSQDRRTGWPHGQAVALGRSLITRERFALWRRHDRDLSHRSSIQKVAPVTTHRVWPDFSLRTKAWYVLFLISLFRPSKLSVARITEN